MDKRERQERTGLETIYVSFPGAEMALGKAYGVVPREWTRTGAGSASGYGRDSVGTTRQRWIQAIDMLEQEAEIKREMADRIRLAIKDHDHTPVISND